MSPRKFPSFLSKINKEIWKKLSADFADFQFAEGDSYDGGNLTRGLLGIVAFNAGDPRTFFTHRTLSKVDAK